MYKKYMILLEDISTAAHNNTISSSDKFNFAFLDAAENICSDNSSLSELIKILIMYKLNPMMKIFENFRKLSHYNHFSTLINQFEN